ncbi:hypothetical protein EZ449_06785 [Pedobacter frigidisoli]|uniref:Uncharacterized protein n=1 Tax=Pedobacter frigidisoli TaxID=2530455 RepID=A0A4V2MN34_9SPHI|nr:hypothetical protein [Pedobacter frigidisoli]TCD11190.1 hypothetical protein EZ449_06785 [Pedobacter frigidisoli]
MKKNKSKSKTPSASKKARKELESKLAVAFNEVVAPFGKAKKTDKVIEKFAKQLSKRVSISVKDDSMAPFIKEEKALVEKQKPVMATKETVKKTKAVEKEVTDKK